MLGERAVVDFAELYSSHRRRVFGLCRRLLNSPQEAEDATQEVFLRARQRWVQFDRESSFGGWILAVARNYCIDCLRRRQREERLFIPFGEGRPATHAAERWSLDSLVAGERRGELRKAVAALPEKYRVPLVLVYYEELSYGEVGDVLGVDRKHVAVLVFRGRRQLRRMLMAGRKTSGVS